MATELLDRLIRESAALSTEERLRLAAYLVERAKDKVASGSPRRKWRELRGLGKPSLLRQDAQDWVSCTRQEADDRGLQ